MCRDNQPIRKAFPVDTILPQLLTQLQQAGTVILEAPPGTGKTTRVPPALLALPALAGQKILMLEPRRLAAVNAASFMSRQLGEEVGETVGYTIRHERLVSAATRIEVVTEGVLTRRLQSDPELNGVGVVIFDEFHERNLHSDLALALCRDVRLGLRPDLKLVVMSATLDADRLLTLLEAPPVLRCDARLYPVAVHYSARDAAPASLLAETCEAVRRAVEETDGDILVFLPGAEEIRRAVDRLRTELPALSIHPLYGGLAFDEQRRAIEPGPRRKIVVATNVAETSLTIEGVRVVVDSGFEKRPRYDAAQGTSRLELVRISAASATQRAGRAGRLGDGACYRLWSEGTQGGLLPQTPPEIGQADLAPLALDLANWGVIDAQSLGWVDPPPDGHLRAARRLLQQLGALDADNRLTREGIAMAALPTHPRYARLLAQAGNDSCPEQGAALVALLDEPLPRSGEVDLCELLPRLDWNAPLLRRGLAYWQRRAGSRPGPVRFDGRAVARLLASAFPDRVARLQREGEIRYRLVNGTVVELDPSSSLRGSEYLVIVAMQGRAQTRPLVRLAAPLERDDVEQLFAQQIAWQRHVAWDEARQQVLVEQRRCLGALVLQSRPDRPEPGDLRAALLERIVGKGLVQLPWSNASLQLLERLRFLSQQLGDTGWPEFSEETLLAELPLWLAPSLEGIRSLNELTRVDLAAALLARLDWTQRRRLDELAPERIRVPGGSNVRLDYSGAQPVLAVKLQELFGLAASPRIVDGRVPVLIHLLSPAGRPLQVTADLQSFWQNGYPEVKKEMKGRYPRHPWPDDPWTAVPTRRTTRRTRE